MKYHTLHVPSYTPLPPPPPRFQIQKTTDLPLSPVGSKGRWVQLDRWYSLLSFTVQNHQRKQRFWVRAHPIIASPKAVYKGMKKKDQKWKKIFVKHKDK